MPRASKRKADPPNPSSVTSAPDSRAASGKSKMKGTKLVDALFNTYANSSSGVIEPEGIEALCSAVGVEHTDVRILMFAWKLKAQRQGYFTQDEWRTGLKALGVDSLNKLKKALPELQKEVEMPENFEDFYSFAFQYCLTEEKQKGVDIETICELLNLVLGSKFRPMINSFLTYLKVQSEYKVLNRDQWINILRFCREISFPDFANYDETTAWPLILDNFVDWMKEKQA